jgi:hypothetical protein
LSAVECPLCANSGLMQRSNRSVVGSRAETLDIRRALGRLSKLARQQKQIPPSL